uniref:FAM21/CAPZIP domain-containing protein n=1 Tax=Clastoptera arizonana TaxID=38151 RepID=A0A1B6EA28_9HEMI
MAHKEKKNNDLWTTENIREESKNWTLEADAELLKYLQQFSQKLVLETHSTLKSIDALESQLNTTYVKFSTTSNKFISLSDTQFIENRVYEDDETTLNVETTKDNHTTNDDKTFEKLKGALNIGFQVLNEKFEAIKVLESDSEDDDDDDHLTKGEVMLKPIDPYKDNVLPYLIGSADFNSDDTVGLGDLPSEDEIEEALSESSRDSTSEGSEPESDQIKVDQILEVDNHKGVLGYKEISFEEQLTNQVGIASIQKHTDNNKGLPSLASTPENSSKQRRLDTIKTPKAGITNSSGQSTSSNTSSEDLPDIATNNKFGTHSISDSDETDDLFSNNSSTNKEVNHKGTKKPVGGVSVLRIGVQLPDRNKEIPHVQQTKSNSTKQIQNSNNSGSNSEEEKTGKSFTKTLSKNKKPHIIDEDDDLFAKPQGIDKTDKSNIESNTISPSKDIFSGLKSNKSSVFDSNRNGDLNRSFWLDSDGDKIGNDANLFGGKSIFSDDEDDFLFTPSDKTKLKSKEAIAPKEIKILPEPSSSNNQEQVSKQTLFNDDIFFNDKSSLSGANFLDIVSDGKQSLNKKSNKGTYNDESLFDDLFSDTNGEDDLFKDILPRNKTINDTPKTTISELLQQTITKEDTKIIEENQYGKQNNEQSDTTSKNGNNLLQKIMDDDFGNDDDLFTEPSHSTGSFLFSLKGDKHKSEIKLFDDSGSDDDLFSTSKTLSSKPLKLSKEENSDGPNLFHNVKNVSLNSDDLKPSLNSSASISKEIIHDNLSRNTEDIKSNNDTNGVNMLYNVDYADSKSAPLKLPKLVEDLTTTCEDKIIENQISEDKVQPPNTLNLKIPPSQENLFQSQDEVVSPDVNILSSPSPGKLKPELFGYINPSALLPGAKPKFTNHSQHHTLPNTDTISTLQCVVKERVKIQVKRRPPTRKARKEAIKVSKLEEDKYDNSNHSTCEPNESQITSKLSSLVSNESCIINDSNKIEIKDSNKSIDKSNSLNKESSNVTEIRPSNSDKKTILETPSLVKNKVDVLFEDESDDDLFNEVKTMQNSSILNSKSIIVNKVKNMDEEVVTKNIDHIEVGEDDDIFGEISTKKNTTSRNESVKIDEEDLFGQSTLTNKNGFTKIKIIDDRIGEISASKNATDSSPVSSFKAEMLKNIISSEEDPLFSKISNDIPGSKPVQKTMPFENKDIFSEDNDIFNTFDSNSPFSTNKEIKIGLSGKTNFLFADEDDDLDIFSPITQVRSSKETRTSDKLGSNAGQSSQKNMLTSQQVFMDPLMLPKND